MENVSVVKVTPKMASEWLEKNSSNFRKLDKARVMAYARAMDAGRWEENGQTIAFSRDGLLLDGQHRLHAIVESGCTIKLIVIHGLTCQGEFIDRGKPRTVNQFVARNGVKNCSTIVSAARLCVSHEKGLWSRDSLPVYLVADHEVIDFCMEHNESMNNLLALCNNGLLPTSTMLGTMFIANRMRAEPLPLVEQFCNSVASGVNLDLDSPALQLRNKLAASKGTKRLSYFAMRMILTMAWNKAAKGQPCRSLVFRLGESKTKNPNHIELAPLQNRFA